jgi:hypothetical protein
VVINEVTHDRQQQQQHGLKQGSDVDAAEAVHVSDV